MKQNNRNLIRIFVIVAAAACILLGVLQGDAQDTLRKAATICLECIGIG